MQLNYNAVVAVHGKKRVLTDCFIYAALYIRDRCSQSLTRPLSNVFTYRLRLCIRHTFFLQFLSQSRRRLKNVIGFKFINATKSREIDPKRRYFRHPVYGDVMAKFLLREVMVLFACT